MQESRWPDERDVVDPDVDSARLPATTATGARPADVARAEASVARTPRLERDPDGAWLAGLCTGIARHLHWPVLTVRLAFVALGLTQFIGLVTYGILWLLVPRKGTALAPGLEAATHQGMRDADVAKKRLGRRDVAVIVGIGVAAVATLAWMRFSGVGLSDKILWPVAFAATGLALLWRQADDLPASTERESRRWYSSLLQLSGWAAVLRVVVGLSLVGGAVSLVAVNTGVAAFASTLAVVALTFLGLGLVAAPWIHRYRRQLTAAHEEKLLADARADMAAHLHDSVLQTLALIQRQAEDPKAVATLARRQERELRTWLYGDVPDVPTLKAALTRAAAEIEDERGVPVELVVVGDCELTSDGHALVRAAREAMMNAAKHSGADLIDVYAEAFGGDIEVFVRDRGKGFDMATIDEDRMGVRRSIIDRMERHGGKAVIRSAPGEGTEVRLELQQ